MIVVLPSFLRGLAKASSEGSSRSEIDVEASCLDSLRDALRHAEPEIADRCWAGTGEIRRDMVLVLNEELVPKSSYGRLRLETTDELRILMQFAGG